MDIFNVLSMIGGLALFLYGMNAMGDGLSKMAGGKLETVLEKLTSKKIFAVLVGAGVTAVIQSSSATTVMVVGFVNSGIMKLGQAVGIIMGANVGTTVTSWILSLTGLQGDSLFITLLKPSSFSPVLAAIGIVLTMMASETSRKKDIGNILVGFAILMFGMEMMSDSVSGLAENPAFTSLMTAFSNPLLGMAAGAILTAVIQSSSASVGILQALCATGAVHYSMALPIIMGQNIGTCVTSLLSSIGASKNARRAAMIHLYFNLIGTIVFTIAFYSVNMFADFAFMSMSANAAGIAVIHSAFNIGATLMLFPMSNKLVRLAEMTIKDKPDDAAEAFAAVSIDERFLDSPAFAMTLCREKSHEMAKHAVDSMNIALEVLCEYDKDKFKEVERLEALVDQYEDVIGSYLVKLSGKSLSTEDSRSLSIILHTINDFERISDHAKDIAYSAMRLNSKGLKFSPDADKEIRTLGTAITDILAMTADCFKEVDLEEAKHVEPLEQTIDDLVDQIKNNHVQRLRTGQCTIEMGATLDDVLTSLERVSDHCSNVAVELITIHENRFNTHEYFSKMTGDQWAKFNEECAALAEKYQLG